MFCKDKWLILYQNSRNNLHTFAEFTTLVEFEPCIAKKESLLAS